MIKNTLLIGVLVAFAGGCAMPTMPVLQEVRHKNRVGVEEQHKGSSDTNAERYTVAQGVEFKWDKGLVTGVEVRRRDQNEGDGDNDTGLWFDVSYPLWQAAGGEKHADNETRELRLRIEELEGRMAAQSHIAVSTKNVNKD